MKLEHAANLEKAIKDTDLNCEIGRWSSGAFVLINRGTETIFFDDQLDDDELNTTVQMVTTLIQGGYYEN